MKKYKPKYKAKAKHFHSEIFGLFTRNAEDREDIFAEWSDLTHTGIATILPTYQVDEIKSTYDRLRNEMVMVMVTTYYLYLEMTGNEERDGMFQGEVNFNKCFYHVDNYYHRSYVLEEMAYRLVGKLLLHKSITMEDKAHIADQLGNLGYNVVANLLKNLSNKRLVKDARKRRRHITHRTGYSAEELLKELVSFEDMVTSGDRGKKQHKKPTKRVIEAKKRRFCMEELEKMIALTKIYEQFTLNLLDIINNRITEPG